jgi:hypothetical protein
MLQLQLLFIVWEVFRQGRVLLCPFSMIALSVLAAVFSRSSSITFSILFGSRACICFCLGYFWPRLVVTVMLCSLKIKGWKFKTLWCTSRDVIVPVSLSLLYHCITNVHPHLRLATLRSEILFHICLACFQKRRNGSPIASRGEQVLSLRKFSVELISSTPINSYPKEHQISKRAVRNV